MSAGKSTTPLCTRFGVDANWRETRLSLIGLGSYHQDQVRLLHNKILTRDTTVDIVDHFFQQLLQHKEAAGLLASFDIGHLKERQIRFFTDYGVCYTEAAYCESRLRIGLAHMHVGVPLGLYLTSFGILQDLILEVVQACMDGREERRQLTGLVVKLNSLDIALATELYQRTRMQEADFPQKFPQGRQPLHQQLEQDTLTGVTSRTDLLREMEVAVSRAGKTGQPLAVVMADLDHFKAVNECHGHLVGDKVLKEVAARIKAALREFDLVGRYGGEEFVILLENTVAHTAYQIAERIRQRVCGDPVQPDAVSAAIPVTISQGMAVYTDGDDIHSLLGRADKAMFRAKESGRNCIVEPG